ncbi:MAG: cytochrome b N-terminal domain-containing protein [Acidimicrobiales bacterium]|nr:cytochrome b N-terminal domain-containing protein [Acidimicrobiales bacterium]MCB9394833.1 cytochrome b N-terminal domain-containing protein [Acidimicrobiaceae bacterium]
MRRDTEPHHHDEAAPSARPDHTDRAERGVVAALERATYRAETPVRRWVGFHRLNPLPHAGTISVFLLGVVIATGVYITLFFSFGFEASYRSVEKMTDHPIQGVVRTIHRYASAALVLTTLVHAWRIFVAGRFRGPRRWRWATGVASLSLVWLAGVTGYWLVWDRRAQAITEASTEVFDVSGTVRSIAVRDLHGSGTGWSLLFVLWLVHLLLTVVIGWFLYRHVRRTRLRVVPPRHWMLLMFVALLAVSLAFPADLLGPADPSALVADMPLDPFVLFLLPPLLGGHGAWFLLLMVVVIAGAIVLPHLVARRPAVAVIDPDACTGCELCVVDCPYQALTMQTRADVDTEAGTQPRRPVAVLDADACVGCGICIGSCSFGAIELPGFDAEPKVEPEGKHVVLACRRHVAATAHVPDDPGTVVVPVACAGMIHAQTVGSLMSDGALGVQVVGCAAGDCAYGIGNRLIAERLDGSRAPHVPGKYRDVAVQDYVAPTELARAVADPAAHSGLDADHPPKGTRQVAAAAVVVGSIVAVALATRAPFAADDDRAAVRVIVDHVPGRQLEGQPAATGAVGTPVEVVVLADDVEVVHTTVGLDGDAAVGLVDVDVPVSDAVELEVLLVEGGQRTDLYHGTTPMPAGRRLLVHAVDVPPEPGVAEGRAVFEDPRRGGCGVCHSTEIGQDRVGPSLGGVADRAGTRIAGMTAEEYLHESILDPDAYVVDGFRAGQMLPLYGERLSPDEVDALVLYLMSLTAGDVEDGS